MYNFSITYYKQEMRLIIIAEKPKRKMIGFKKLKQGDLIHT